MQQLMYKYIAYTFLITIAITLGGKVFSQPSKVIIDCDPGIDDALALCLAMESPKFEIIGITTIFGNTTLGQATKNALNIVELSQMDIPIYRGAAYPMHAPLKPPPTIVHGEDGLGNIHLAKPTLKPKGKPAAQFIVDMVNQYPGEITILAVGPLTNLAQAIKLQPGIAQKVKEVVIMGGAFTVPGNTSPVSEANIDSDPHAADIVCTTPWKMTFIPLDVTMKVKIDISLLAQIREKNEKFGTFIYDISQYYINFYQNIPGIEKGFYAHDPSAVMYMVDPTLFSVEKGPVRIATEGIAAGQTIMATKAHLYKSPWKGKPIASAALKVDSEKLLESFMSIMANNP